MGLSRRKTGVFLTLWTVAILATASAFVVHLTLRGRTVALGFELGRTHAEQARLREVKRVLQVEAASYRTPERVELVARTLLGMEPAPAERMISLAPLANANGSNAQDDVARPAVVTALAASRP